MKRIVCILLFIVMACPAIAQDSAPTLCTKWTVVDGETITCNGKKVDLLGIKALSHQKNKKATDQAVEYNIDVNTVIMLGKAGKKALERQLEQCTYLAIYADQSLGNTVYCDNVKEIIKDLLCDGYVDSNNRDIYSSLCTISPMSSKSGVWGFFPATESTGTTGTTGGNTGTSPKVGDIAKTITFPAGTTWVSDAAFDKSSNSFWLLCPYNKNTVAPLKLIQLDQNSSVLKTIVLNDPPFSLNQSSEITSDGQYLYATSYGYSNGLPQAFIYKIDTNGNIVNTFPCPSTTTGFCEGLIWDGIYLWAGASDNKNLVQFSSDGAVQKTLSNVFQTNGIKDISFDSSTGQLIAIKDQRSYRINKTTGTLDSEQYISSGIYQGDWDGQLFWSVNYNNQQLEGIYIGN